jgi:hypothetical protein
MTETELVAKGGSRTAPLGIIKVRSNATRKFHYLFKEVGIEE